MWPFEEGTHSRKSIVILRNKIFFMKLFALLVEFTQLILNCYVLNLKMSPLFPGNVPETKLACRKWQEK